MKLIALTILLLTANAIAEQVEAITRPSADVTLSFIRSGIVQEVKITPGKEVKKGQVLLQLNDEIELNKIDELQTQIDNKTKKLAEEMQLTQKRQDLEDLKKAFAEGAGTKKEYDHALVEVKKSEFAILQMNFEKKILKKKLAESRILLGQTRILSPVDGLVENILIEVGEGVERLKEVIRLVNIDPLWMDVPVSLQAAHRLKYNSLVKVHFPAAGSTAKQTLEGRVIYKAAVADAGSETLIFRIEVKNPHKRLAGERVKIELPREAL